MAKNRTLRIQRKSSPQNAAQMSIEALERIVDRRLEPLYDTISSLKEDIRTIAVIIDDVATSVDLAASDMSSTKARLDEFISNLQKTMSNLHNIEIFREIREETEMGVMQLSEDIREAARRVIEERRTSIAFNIQNLTRDSEEYDEDYEDDEYDEYEDVMDYIDDDLVELASEEAENDTPLQRRRRRR